MAQMLGPRQAIGEQTLAAIGRRDQHAAPEIPVPVRDRIVGVQPNPRSEYARFSGCATRRTSNTRP